MPDMTRNKLQDGTLRKIARGEIEVPKAGKPDGGNLHLLKMPDTGTLVWKVFYRFRGNAKTIRIGHYPAMSLAAARKRRDEVEKLVDDGVDPKAVRKNGGAPSTGMTFKAFVEAYGKDFGPPGESTFKQWKHALTTKMGALLDMTPEEITAADIAEVLRPIWTSKFPTAEKRLQWIAVVLRAARRRNLIKTIGWENPAEYRNFKDVMKKPADYEETPRASMGYEQTPDFMVELRMEQQRRETALKLAEEFLVLTSVRVMECLRGAQWGFIKDEGGELGWVWTIPKEYMKGQKGKKRMHRVPLTPAALDVLERAKKYRRPGCPYVFPTPHRNHYKAKEARALLRRLSKGVTNHGFRSTMFVWTQEVSDHSDRVANAALAHLHITKDEHDRTQTAAQEQRAYDRATYMTGGKRRRLMQDWNAYCVSKIVPVANEVEDQTPAARAA